MPSRADESRLLADLFLRAPVGLATWDSVLGTLASATRSARAQIIGIGGPLVAPFNLVTGKSEELLARCNAFNGHSEAVNFRVALGRHAGDMTIVDDRDYAAVRSRRAFSIYDQFCDEVDIPFGAQTMLASGAGSTVGIALLRSRRDGPVTAEARSLFAAMLPHARAAVRTQVALRHEGHALLAGAFDGLSIAAITIDGYGRVKAVTPAADALLRASARLRIVDGAIESRVTSETRTIERVIVRALGEAPFDGEDIALPKIAELSGEIRVAVRRLPRSDVDFGHGPRAVITLRTVEALGSEQIGRTAAAYGLTSAEAGVACALADGMTREHIAELRGVSVNTVKTQLKSAFMKIGVSREADLVRQLRRFR